MNWFWNILISIDQFFNVLLSPIINKILKPDYRFGYPDETLSSVMGKNQGKCRACYWVCRALHLLDKNHCSKSIELDEGDKID